MKKVKGKKLQLFELGQLDQNCFCHSKVLLFNFLILKLLFIKGLQNIIPEGNDNFEIVPIGFDFLFFNRIYKNVTISTNGFILFNSTSRCCTTSSIPKLSNVITAFHYDIDTLQNGQIYFERINSSSSEMVNVLNEINIISPNFTPKNVFKITYDKVKVNYYGLISFQIILSTDGKISFVTLKYSECLSVATLLSPPGINCVNLKGQSVKIPIGDPCLSSNVNIKGTWIFDVTEDCKL